MIFYEMGLLAGIKVVAYRLIFFNQMTGAKVIVQEPRLGARDRIITIFGTPDQTQGAEKLLRSFISYGESISSLKRTLL